MKIDTLREFLYLSHELNFSSTARHFFINQAALSRHIAALEKELGCELFVRNTHSVRLTAAGECLAGRCEELIVLHDRIIEDMRNEARRRDSVLRIGYLQGASGFFIEAANKLFKRDRPDVSLVMRSLEPRQILERLAKDEIDVGVTMFPPGKESSQLVIKKLYADQFVLMMKATNRLASCASVSPDQLRGGIFVSRTFPHDPELSGLVRRRLDQAGIPYTTSEEVDDVESMNLLFQDSSSVYISCGHLKRMFKPKFKFVPIKGVDMSFDVCTTWKKSRQSQVILDYASCLEYGYDLIASAADCAL